MTLSDTRTDRHLTAPLRPQPSPDTGLPQLPGPPFQRAVPNTPMGQNGCFCRLLPRSTRAFPVSQAGRRPSLHFRGLLRLHSRYGPLDCSTAHGGLCHEASVQPVARLNRSSATRSYRQLPGWILPPLVNRAVGAHCETRASPPGGLVALGATAAAVLSIIVCAIGKNEAPVVPARHCTISPVVGFLSATTCQSACKRNPSLAPHPDRDSHYGASSSQRIHRFAARHPSGSRVPELGPLGSVRGRTVMFVPTAIFQGHCLGDNDDDRRRSGLALAAVAVWLT